jgi:hypothetical protein
MKVRPYIGSSSPEGELLSNVVDEGIGQAATLMPSLN